MITVNNLEPSFSVFPNGEFNVALSKTVIKTLEDGVADINWHFNGNDELLKLGILVSALEPHVYKINVNGGYLPYSRMDRYEKDKYNPFSLRTFINMLPVPADANVSITYSYSDVHNVPVAEELFVMRAHDNVNFSFLISGANIIYYAKSYLDKFEKALVVLPDKGSLTRYSQFINDGKMSIKGVLDAEVEVAMGYKKRDFDTHEITDFGITKLTDNSPIDREYVESFDKIIIIDDIVSYGNTFINLIDYLGNLGANTIDLFAGNVEDALWRGDLLGNKYLGNVYTTNYLTNHNQDDKVIIINSFISK